MFLRLLSLIMALIQPQGEWRYTSCKERVSNISFSVGTIYIKTAAAYPPRGWKGGLSSLMKPSVSQSGLGFATGVTQRSELAPGGSCRVMPPASLLSFSSARTGRTLSPLTAPCVRACSLSLSLPPPLFLTKPQHPDMIPNSFPPGCRNCQWAIHSTGGAGCGSPQRREGDLAAGFPSPGGRVGGAPRASWRPWSQVVSGAHSPLSSDVSTASDSVTASLAQPSPVPNLLLSRLWDIPHLAVQGISGPWGGWGCLSSASPGHQQPQHSSLSVLSPREVHSPVASL
ncbi:hypothetical protein HJG60_009405 [Phyllostomus discolor]|uniref:Uncharacterized protein n=1 Tax=Phyllostomus discolor TaxID=89673 RepID=A0A833YFM0_9CHIR|nr:hypothetical protein HJG60_009405 [Phyllostomus discolor]